MLQRQSQKQKLRHLHLRLLHLLPHLRLHPLQQPLLLPPKTTLTWSQRTSEHFAARHRGDKADGSYDAAEDNELSFKEGDKITDIDKVDEDWWQGRANGNEGLFPGECASLIRLMMADDVAAYVVAPEDYQP